MIKPHGRKHDMHTDAEPKPAPLPQPDDMHTDTNPKKKKARPADMHTDAEPSTPDDRRAGI